MPRFEVGCLQAPERENEGTLKAAGVKGWWSCALAYVRAATRQVITSSLLPECAGASGSPRRQFHMLPRTPQSISQRICLLA